MQRPRLWHGVLGGLVGGIVFAAIMVINGTLTSMGMMTLPLIGKLVGHHSAWVGFAVHLVNSALIGAGYIILFGRFLKGMVDGLHYGMIYGAMWWFIGPLTLMPLLLGIEIGSHWTFTNALNMFPSLIGHLVFGVILGLTVGEVSDLSLPPEKDRIAAAEAEDSQVLEEREAERPAAPPEREVAEPVSLPQGRASLALTMGTILAVFVMNLVIFGYALTTGLPRASEGHEPASARVESAAQIEHSGAEATPAPNDRVESQAAAEPDSGAQAAPEEHREP